MYILTQKIFLNLEKHKQGAEIGMTLARTVWEDSSKEEVNIWIEINQNDENMEWWKGIVLDFLLSITLEGFWSA